MGIVGLSLLIAIPSPAVVLSDPREAAKDRHSAAIEKCTRDVVAKATPAEASELGRDVGCLMRVAASLSNAATSRTAKLVELTQSQAALPHEHAELALATTPARDVTTVLGPIPSIFDVKTEILCDKQGSPTLESGPCTGGYQPRPEDASLSEGAFRFICNASHESYDDPIVYWGQPGKSHLHQFFGNTEADANSTYQSLRTAGDSTCMSPVNRSAYWMPAMMNGRGQVVRPDWVGIYYKRIPLSNPKCHRGNPQAQGDCVALPRGLRFVFGYNMTDPSKSPTGSLWFNCDGPTAVSGHYATIVEAAKNCPPGNKLGAIIQAPDCWDGVHLDSADHRSHVAYANYENGLGFRECPKTHPLVIPQFQLGAWYTTDADLDRTGAFTPGKTKTWYLSSDDMGDHMMVPGSTFHSDWFGAWDESVMKTWMDNCIDRGLNCSGGQLGDGTVMKQFAGFKWEASSRLVDPPAR